MGLVNDTKEVMENVIDKDVQKKQEVKIKEYDEIQCNKCDTIMRVEETLTMKDGRRGICVCPKCGKQNRVVKTRPADDDYNVVNGGQRIRKNPKLHLSKKQRRKLNKELKNG